METAKQYATQLVEEIRKEIYWGVITTADVNPERERARLNKAKTVALICVDKMINLLDELDTNVDADLYGNIKQFKDVRTEINKM